MGEIVITAENKENPIIREKTKADINKDQPRNYQKIRPNKLK